MRTGPQKAKSKTMATTGIIAAFMLFLVILVSYWALIKPPEGQAHIGIHIKPGSTAEEIGRSLKEKQVIRSPWVFAITAQWKGQEKFTSGNYVLRQGMSVSGALERLAAGPIITEYTVTIPEGFTIEQIVERLSNETKIDSAEFARLAKTGAKDQHFRRYEFLSANPNVTLEGHLFPKTYTITENTSAKDLVKLMLDQYEKEVSGLAMDTARSDLSSHQILTIASLIEAEAKVGEERPLISAVIYNRLSNNMRLQIDATVQYALPERKEKLTGQDLKIDSPYNTYLHEGLPPAPICNPGLDSIKSAISPAQVNYLYYVLTGPDGKHTFTDSYQEFLDQKKGSKTR